MSKNVFPSEVATIKLPVSLDDLAAAISQLSQKQREELELAFTPEEESEITKRRKETDRLVKNGGMLTISDL